MEIEGDPGSTMIRSPTCYVKKDGEIVRRWMEMVLGDKVLTDLPRALHSGELLCDLINKLYRALGMKSQISPQRCTADDEDCDVGALSNVLEYLRACEVLGVARRDLFQPDDLLKSLNMEKVYNNILSLQSVAVFLSNRRSIDERSSMVDRSNFSPTSEQCILADDSDDLDFNDLVLESPDAIQMLQQSRWQRLLFEYEHQQQRKEERNRAGDSSATDGMGPLAHGIWRTEERIRALLFRDDDREFGAVPENLHGKLWMLASGAQMEMQKSKGQYERLLATKLVNTEATRQIDVDLHRTVSDEDKELWTEGKSKMLRRVLVAYSLYNPSLGYCQGLNYIVARSLHYLDEEEAFYLLIAIIRLVPDDYYTTMLGLAVDQHVFADLVRLQYPEVSEHLSELGGSGMELSLACTEWFLTLFASPCDRKVTLEIWDAIFLQGDEILFRVALALLQQAKSALIACTTYGDMLKHLNEIGRGEINATELMKNSRKQDCVIRDRIEDFRAHHRLQLASGIVASTVGAEDTRSSTTERHSSDSRSEPRLKLFNRKKQGAFRHIDKIPPRLSRTFDRNVTDEYIESIRNDHTNFAAYYDGMQPQLKEEYWSSAGVCRQWGARTVRRVSADDAIDSSKHGHKSKGPRMKSETNLRGQESKKIMGVNAGEGGSGSTRDLRSKSSVFIPVQPNRILGNSASSAPNSRLERDSNGDVPVVGRSPLAWIQRFEEWHKDMKNQKKQRAEKKRVRRSQRSASMFPHTRNGGSDTSIAHLRGGILHDSSPKCSQTHISDDIKSFALGHRRRSNDYPRLSTEKLEEPPLSRSYSDSFRSPASIERRHRRQTTNEQAQHNVMLRQHDVDEVPQKYFREVRKLVRNANGRSSRGFSDQSTLSTSTNSYVNTGSFTLDPQDETHNELSSDHSFSRKSVRRRQLSIMTHEKQSFANELLNSPVHRRSSSMDLGEEVVGVCAPPQIRRIASDPNDEASAQQKRGHSPHRLYDCSEAMRERANVLQYMHRKASDASSIASSIPRSPGGNLSDSSRLNDQSSNRSARSIQFRKSSFLFFDKLSNDLESSTHGVDWLVDEAEVKNDTLGRGSVSSEVTGRSSTVEEQRPLAGVISMS